MPYLNLEEAQKLTVEAINKLEEHEERLYKLEERIDRQRGQITWMVIVVFVLVVLTIYLMGVQVSPV